MMKQLCFLFLLITMIGWAACKKEQPTSKPNNTKIINDTIRYKGIGSTSYKIDLDGDSINDVTVKFYDLIGHYQNSSDISLVPLDSSLFIPLTSRDFYFINDTISCSIDTSLFTFYSINYCDSSDSSMNHIEQATYVRLNNNEDHLLVPFTQEMMIVKTFSSGFNSLCGFVSSYYRIGEAFPGSFYFQFATSNGIKYQVNCKHILPNLIIESITKTTP